MFAGGLRAAYAGRVVARLASDPDLLRRSGAALVAATVAQKYGGKDVDGSQPHPLALDEA
jgi:hypothetical protein